MPPLSGFRLSDLTTARRRGEEGAMGRVIVRRWPWVTLLFSLVAVASCRTTPESPPQTEATRDRPAPPEPTFLDYVDSDAFDALFESTLVSQVPAIVIRTGHPKPDWGGRLNAWIAAWNMGGHSGDRKVRGQSPLPRVVVDGESIREFRLLVTGLMDRVDWLARGTSVWWAEERVRSSRVQLLRPYNLRFHMGEDGNIQLIFFHGKHRDSYPRFMRSLTGGGEEPAEWSRTYECSLCRAMREGGVPAAPAVRRAESP